MKHTLTIIAGPKPGQSIDLEEAAIVIGRSPTCDLAIDSNDLSREHARLELTDAGYQITDLGSRYGTFVNGQRIKTPTPLTDGAHINLGRTIELRYAALADAKDVDVAPPPDVVAAPTVPITIEPKPPASPPQTVAIETPAADPGQQTTPIETETGSAQTTMVGSLTGFDSSPDSPPTLVVQVARGTTQEYTLTAPAYTIGRLAENDITIDSPIISRRHGRLEKSGNTYKLIPGEQTTNPFIVDGRPISAPRDLSHNAIVRIGSTDPGMMVTLTYRHPASLTAAGPADIDFAGKDTIQIGRDPSNDICLNIPTVSRYHAVVQKIGQRFRIRDLKSANGTFVNGERVEGERWLEASDEVKIGSYRFVIGQRGLTQFDEDLGMSVDAINLNKWVRKDLNILQNISFNINPREFVVVVGQSGGGKSTLVDAIAGYRAPTHGKVFINDIDVYKNFDAIRNDIGYVPQRDIIHMDLTVFDALDYAAQLRMPPDTTKAERHVRIEEVLQDLDIAHRRDNQVKSLSGGQQKRVSIGVELITRPNLFFLDEPSSGLDPGTETALMQLMRRLADQGRTIMLITHATKNVVLADKVIFLARGGYLAWFGPPDEALQYFDQYRTERERRISDMEFDQIYNMLEDENRGTAPEWAERYTQSPAYQEYIVQKRDADHERQVTQDDTLVKRSTSNTVSAWRQLTIISSRNLKLLMRDRFSLVLMLLLAPVVASLDLVLATFVGNAPFDNRTGSVPDAIMSLLLMQLYAVMVGAFSQMREIVKEQDIYRRERLVNLKIFPYVMSKVWIAVLLAIYQAFAYVGIHYLAFEMPGGTTEFMLLYFTLLLASMAGMMVGLTVSAIAPNPNSAPLLVIFPIVIQIVLAGVIIPLPGFGQVISAFTVTRWGYQTAMAIVGPGSYIAGDSCWIDLTEDERSELTVEERSANCDCMGTSLFDLEKCAAPGLLDFYTPEIDADPPESPPSPPMPDRPTLVLPEQPPIPEDLTNQLAVVAFFEDLEAWQVEAEVAQTDFEAEVATYESEVSERQEQYEAEFSTYTTDIQSYEGARQAAISGAEAVINDFYSRHGWAMVDKRDSVAYSRRLLLGWGALTLMIALLFTSILIIQKRKDIV